jgi:hypothetical protein
LNLLYDNFDLIYSYLVDDDKNKEIHFNKIAEQGGFEFLEFIYSARLFLYTPNIIYNDYLYLELIQQHLVIYNNFIQNL